MNHLNPPPVEEPAESEPVQEAEAPVVDEVQESPAQPSVVFGVPPAATTTAVVSTLSFMQESELEQDQIQFEEGAEWIEKHDIGESQELHVQQESYVDTDNTFSVHTQVAVSLFR